MKSFLITIFLLLVLGSSLKSQTKNDSAAGLKTANDNNKGFSRLEKTPQFPGGLAGWRTFLENNLDASAPIKDDAPFGNYSVKVQFLVDEDGTVKNVQIVKKPKECPTCAVAAEKIFRKSPKWEAAVQGGRHVKCLQTQMINFQRDNDF